MLTKSDYLRYLECPIHLWLHHHRSHEVSHHIDPNLQWIFEQGDMVEAQARRLFPDADMVKGHTQKSEEQTKALIAGGSTAIFQATATADGLLAMADILQLDPDTKEWNLYEVKSTTELEDTHLHDVCFQMIVFKKAGYTMGKLHLIHINPDYVRQGEIDVKSFLIIEDITEQVYAFETEVLAQIAAAKQVEALDEMPSCDGCTCVPKDCPCHQYCYPDLPDYSIFNLYRVKGEKARELYRSGIRNLLDLPLDYKATTAQACQLQVARTREPIIEAENIRAELSNVTYPVTFLDYETFFPAIPLFDGYKPYQQMVFQFSVHVLDENGDLKHHECLVRSMENPVTEIVRCLNECCPQSGSVIVWNKSFEKGRNDEMAALLPEYASMLQSINSRTYDLMDIFRKLYYVHPDFRGSCSIKKVLPVLVPSLSYKDLVIQEGGTASLSWYRALTDGRTEEEKQKTFDHMLAYCKLDTLAMVEVFQVLTSLQ